MDETPKDIQNGSEKKPAGDHGEQEENIEKKLPRSKPEGAKPPGQRPPGARPPGAPVPRPRPKTGREVRRHPIFRRFINITSIIGIIMILLLFFGLPNLVTFQPAFCGQCHSDAKRPVYQQWKTSTHAKIGCMQCHVRPGLKNIFLSRIGLAQEIWMRVVPSEKREKPVGFDSPPTNETCMPCHEARKRISPSGDIVIPHQSHIKIRKLNCVDCHQNFVCRRTSKTKALVSMEGCYRCHNGRRATNECTACHTEKGVPASHRDKWVLQHGTEAQTDKDTCMECHSKPKDFCKSCHGVKPPSHTADFGIAHATYARENKAACLECHDEKGVCAKCHGDTGRQHNENWLGIHPSVARSGIRDCFECHSKIHCNTCHRSPH
jgi:nitrate/TMAO reductase-like tetraheme cytochrome c subunit